MVGAWICTSPAVLQVINCFKLVYNDFYYFVVHIYIFSLIQLIIYIHILSYASDVLDYTEEVLKKQEDLTFKVEKGDGGKIRDL